MLVHLVATLKRYEIFIGGQEKLREKQESSTTSTTSSRCRVVASMRLGIFRFSRQQKTYRRERGQPRLAITEERMMPSVSATKYLVMAGWD